MEEALLALLLGDAGVAALVQDRIYWLARDRATPAQMAIPCVIVRGVVEATDYTMKGPVGLRRPVLTLECLGPDADTALRIRDAVRLRLSGYRGGAFLGVFTTDRGEDFTAGGGETETHRALLDARINFAG